MTDHYFNPVLWSCTIGEKDLINIMQNPFNLYTFKVGCETIEAYLWNATITSTTAEIELLEKN